MRKMLMLAGVMAMFAAFAIPASASANWTMEGVETTETEELKLTGKAKFVGPVLQGSPGIECKVHVTISLTAGTRIGHVTTFTVTNPTTDCTGSGSFAGCTVHEVNATLPWTAEATAPATKEIDLTGVSVNNIVTGEKCPVTEASVVQGATDNITATVNNSGAISTATISGTANNGTATVSGEFEAEPAGTFGWE